MPDYSTLRDEVSTDPLGRGYAAMTDAQLASDMNSLYRVRVVPLVPLSVLAIWAAKTGVRAHIESHADNSSSPVQAVCLSLRDLLTGLGGPPLDLGDTDNQAMLSGLVTAGVLTSSDRDSLLALTKAPISRAVELEGWGVPVQAPDIAAVRNT